MSTPQADYYRLRTEWLRFKSQLFDNRVRLNVSGFYYDYKDLQVTIFSLTSALIQNGPKARLWGTDLDLEVALARGLTLSAGLEAIHSEFVDYPNAPFFFPNPVASIPSGANPTGCVTVAVNPNAGGNCRVERSAKGNELPVTPEFTGNLTLNYRVPLSVGTFGFNAVYYYNSGWYAGSDSSYEQPAYSLVNAQAGWESPDSRYRVTLWGNNLTDKVYGYYRGIAAAFSNILPAPPRTYGVSFSYTY